MSKNIFDYELLDSGHGYRLERFGDKVVARPESIAIWNSQKNVQHWPVDAVANLTEQGKVEWEQKGKFSDWTIDCGSFGMKLHLSETKNIGIFPEQYQNWQWISKVIKDSKKELNVLNLFGYTGGATLAAAAAGAKVCHVDSAKSVINLAKENQIISRLENKPIRWIVDDCKKFVQREVKRGVKYDAIIMDPPAFGKGIDGQIFKFEIDVPYLLKLCRNLMSDDFKFLILNSYSMGYMPSVVHNLLKDVFPKESIESGSLELEETNKRNYRLPCGIYARFVK